MEPKEWSKLWHDPWLNLESFHAVCIRHGFPVHMHDYYVFCFIEKGLQSFSYRKTKYVTPPGGLIILNPGDAHTGEPADEYGFEYRAIYPTISHMQEAMTELFGRNHDFPLFPKVRIDDPELTGDIRALHLSLVHEASPLERESLFLTVLTKAIIRYAEINPVPQVSGKERHRVTQACNYIHAHATEGISLSQVAGYVNFSRYYFLRVFHEEVGMSPHAYLESVRISMAKKLLEKGVSLNQVAHESGFSDQSHFTNRFKRLVGITPGQYVREIRNEYH